MPVTTPVDTPTVAMPGDPLLHVPARVLLNVVVAPTHMLAIPVDAVVGLTVMIMVV